MKKVLIIKKCEDCKHHQFDPDYLQPIYYGKDCCMYWYWNEHKTSEDYPRILENAKRIPEWCPLPDYNGKD